MILENNCKPVFLRLSSMKTILLFLFLPAIAFSQQDKGAAPFGASSPDKHTSGSMHAVVIGISDYQDPAIPDLRFAHRDAEIFANWLRSPAGGSLDGDHLKVLVNQQATAGRIAEALDALIEQTRAGEQVVIYFSGHGDVERKTISQPGFLLCWDAPPQVYMGGGTYSLSFLQEIISTLSVQNKARVLVITDACHAGKLSGSQIGGSQLTASNLARQFANEVKILSCQPNEFSLEGEQWGGGRGVFSYHLVDGLTGLADNNSDKTVTAGELARYLEDRVTPEAAPQSQVPMLLGNRTERLASVDAAALADLQKMKSGRIAGFSTVEQRGLEDDVLAAVDSSIREQYLAFKRAVQDKHFFEPAGMCAEDLYARLVQVQGLAPLRGSMKRNYAAALQDEAQQVMNKWLKISEDPDTWEREKKELNRLPKKEFSDKIKSFPRCLERAAELLGEKHYMYVALKARKHFFEGYILANSNRNPNAELGRQALEQFRQSLQWQSEQPQVYWQMSSVYGYSFLQPDSAEYYARRAMELHPRWVLPYMDMAFLFCVRYEQFARAKQYLEQASRLDSGSALVHSFWGVYFDLQKQYAEAEQYLKKALELDSTNAVMHLNLGVIYRNMHRSAEELYYVQKAVQLDSTYANAHNNLAAAYFSAQRFAEAEHHYQKAIQLDPVFVTAHYNLGTIYHLTRRLDEAERYYLKTIQLDSTFSSAYNNLGHLYTSTNRSEAVEPLFRKAIQMDANNVSAYNNLGDYYLKNRRFADAEIVLVQAVQLDSSEANVQINLGKLYANTERTNAAEHHFKRAIQIDSTLPPPYLQLGFLYTKAQRYDDAEREYGRLIRLVPSHIVACYNLACIHSIRHRVDLSYQFLEQALKNGFRSYDTLVNDSDLFPLREQSERWKALVKKYFPDRVKD